MTIIQTGNTIRKTIKNANRLKTIVGVFAKHGFYNILERIHLGRFVLERFYNSNTLYLSTAERLRLAFEELGPSFIKLGQILATRPDLIPESWTHEFSKLHASVKPLDFSLIESILKQEYPDYSNLFLHLDKEPLGSASIAQVHKAQLKSGESVVVKIQRPQIVQTINEDLSVLYFIAELLETYIEEIRPFKPSHIVDEFFKTLELETNFLIEANNLSRFSENFKTEPEIVIPKVYLTHSTPRVLVMEALDGIPLSSLTGTLDQTEDSPVNAEEIVKRGLSCYLKMVFKDGFFHGDLHAGNFFILPENKIGLIDFGVVGRLNHKTQKAIASMLIALAQEDYEALAHEYLDLAPFNEKTDPDQFARELRDAVAPYFGLTLKNINVGKVLMATAAVSFKNKVSLPTELMLFFKSLIAIEGLSRRIIADFDFLKFSMGFATELAGTYYDPEKFLKEFYHTAKESRSLLYALPRQLKTLLRRFNSPDYQFPLQIKELNSLSKELKKSSRNKGRSQLILAFMLTGSLLSLNPHLAHAFWGLPWLSLVCFAAAFYLMVILFFS